MARTFKEVCEELETLDEVSLLEVLNITSKDIIERFQDKIEENFDELEQDITDNKEGLDFYGEEYS